MIGGSCHKYDFCRDKSFLATNTCLSQQNKSLVATKVVIVQHKERETDRQQTDRQTECTHLEKPDAVLCAEGGDERVVNM